MVDGRPGLVNEVATCEIALRTYLADEIGSLLRNAAFLEALSGHLPGDETTARHGCQSFVKDSDSSPDLARYPSSISPEHGRELQEQRKSPRRDDSTEGRSALRMHVMANPRKTICVTQLRGSVR